MEVRRFIIPVGDVNGKKWWQFWKKSQKVKADEQIEKLISNYKEEVLFDENTGEIKFNNEYWLPIEEK